MDQSAQSSNPPASGMGNPPAKPDTGGGANGDNSKINGDQPIQNLPSNYIVQQKQDMENQQMQATQVAQRMNMNHEEATVQAGTQTANQAKPQAQTPAQNVPPTQQAKPNPSASAGQVAATGAAQAPSAGSGQAQEQGKAAPTQTPPATPQQPANAEAAKDEDPLQTMQRIVDGTPLPEELLKSINERLGRLSMIRQGSGLTSSAYIIELEATQRYVNWTCGLPWNKRSEDILDLKKAREILDKHHYGLEMLKQRMLEYIASIMLNIKNNGENYVTRSPVLCFVGLAGTGKTTFAISMAEALGRQFERVPFGGMADSRVLRGQNRYFPDAEPGQIVKRLVHAQTKNPVILFDEVDRVTETARADIMGVLIELLDPEQNWAFADHYVDHPFNLSNCLFVATSNNMSSVATAVADRMEIIQMPSYNDEEKIEIGKHYVLPKTKKLIGLLEDQFAIDDAVWEIIVRPLGYDPGVRGLERLINQMCRKAAKMIVGGEAKNVKVTVDNVKRFTSEV